MSSQPRSRVAAALTASAALHLLAMWLMYLWVPPDLGKRLFRVGVPVSAVEVEPYRPAPPISVPPPLLEQLRTAAGPLTLDPAEHGVGVLVPELEIPLPEHALQDLAEKEMAPVLASPETLKSAARFLAQVRERPLTSMVEFATEGLVRTVSLIDPETGKLKLARLHIPLRRQKRGPCGICQSLELMRRGFRVPRPVPIRETIHYYPAGYRLKLQEMRDYSVILLDYINVESMAAAAQYLTEGGFAITSVWGCGPWRPRSCALEVWSWRPWRSHSAIRFFTRISTSPGTARRQGDVPESRLFPDWSSTAGSWPWRRRGSPRACPVRRTSCSSTPSPLGSYSPARWVGDTWRPSRRPRATARRNDLRPGPGPGAGIGHSCGWLRAAPRRRPAAARRLHRISMRRRTRR